MLVYKENLHNDIELFKLNFKIGELYEKIKDFKNSSEIYKNLAAKVF